MNLQRQNKIYERQKGETAKAYAALNCYLEMGSERSHSKVATALGKHVSQIHQWSVRWKWADRAKAYDRMLDRRRSRELTKAAIAEAQRRAEREEKIQARADELRMRMLDKTEQILAFPLAKIITDGGKTTVNPAKFVMGDAPKLFKAATQYRRVDDDEQKKRSDRREEVYNIVDYDKPEDDDSEDEK